MADFTPVSLQSQQMQTNRQMEKAGQMRPAFFRPVMVQSESGGANRPRLCDRRADPSLFTDPDHQLAIRGLADHDSLHRNASAD